MKHIEKPTLRWMLLADDMVLLEELKEKLNGR